MPEQTHLQFASLPEPAHGSVELSTLLLLQLVNRLLHWAAVARCWWQRGLPGWLLGEAARSFPRVQQSRG